MNADDLQELYMLLRGSRSATLLLDAQTLFHERKMCKTRDLVLEARRTYAGGRERVLKQEADKPGKGKEGQRQQKRLQKKQDKIREILDKFDEVIPALEKMAEREIQRKSEAEAAASSEPVEISADEDDSTGYEEASEGSDEPWDSDAPPASPCEITPELADAISASSGDEELEVIGRAFSFRPVSSADDIHPDALYFILTDGKSYLLKTLAIEQPDVEIPVAEAIGDKPLKPFSTKVFLRLGRKRKMVLLTSRLSASEEETQERPAEEVSPSDSDSTEEAAKPVPTSTTEGLPNVLDMGAFSQLLTSAQRCGIVPGADLVGHVRDREFRLGQYDKAFQTIEAMYGKFSAAMSQRNQRLQREDADIASGRIRMSPKDLQAKRARDRTATQEIERARRRFQIVLEGLRVLMNSVETAEKA